LPENNEAKSLPENNEAKALPENNEATASPIGLEGCVDPKELRTQSTERRFFRSHGDGKNPDTSKLLPFSKAPPIFNFRLIDE